MNITANVPTFSSANVGAAKTAEAPKKELRVKRDSDHIADRFDDSRDFGNAAAGLMTGAALEGGIAALGSPRLSWEIAENLWQAETLGPNIKFLGTLAAVPAAALNIVAAPLYGAFKGASQALQAGREVKDVLPKDSAAEYTNTRFNGDKEDTQSLTGRWMESLEELGSKKLEPGEKKFDIPVLSPVFSIIGGVISGGISGVVGLVAGLGAGLLTAGKEAVAGAKEGKIGRVLASPLFVGAVPYGMLKAGLSESVPRGFADGWKHGPLKPIVDTAKASATLAQATFKEALER